MFLRDRLLVAVERLIGALCDPLRRERTVIAALAGYGIIWTLYGVLAKASQGVHYDMAELAIWSDHPAWSYPTHPPLAAWIVRAWLTIFPRADWSFYLLSMSSVVLALWLAWRIAGRYLDGEKRVLALAILTFNPLLTFHALKFNLNVALIPLWALATLCFIRSIENRKASDAALLGLAAAAAMLGKYWSIFLLAGLALATLVHPRRDAYWRSAAPWITVAVGALALAPHVAWLVAHQFEPFSFAMTVHGEKTFADTTASIVRYTAGTVAYIALPVSAVLLAVRWSSGIVRDTLLPPPGERRFIAVAFWTPVLLPIVVAPLIGSEIISLWNMAAWTLLPVVLLSPPALTVTRQATNRIVPLAIIWPISAMLAAPSIAYFINNYSNPSRGVHYQVMAKAVDQQWRSATTQPLRYIGGEGDLAYAAVFYLPGTTAFSDFDRTIAPWVDPAAVARDGIALVCRVRNIRCMQRITSYAEREAPFRIEKVRLSNRFLGSDSVTRRFIIVIVPPKSEPAAQTQ